VKDLSPISTIGTNPYVLIVHSGMPVKTVAELIGYVREHPNKFTYAAAGVGSLTHLAAVLFLNRAGIDLALHPEPTSLKIVVQPQRCS